MKELKSFFLNPRISVLEKLNFTTIMNTSPDNCGEITLNKKSTSESLINLTKLVEVKSAQMQTCLTARSASEFCCAIASGESEPVSAASSFDITVLKKLVTSSQESVLKTEQLLELKKLIKISQLSFE